VLRATKRETMKEYRAKVHTPTRTGREMTFKAADDEAAIKEAALDMPGTRENPVQLYEIRFHSERFVARLEGGVAMG
jgi:hypothetical protein